MDPSSLFSSLDLLPLLQDSINGTQTSYVGAWRIVLGEGAILIRWHYSCPSKLNEYAGKRLSPKQGLTGAVKCCLGAWGGSSPGASLQVDLDSGRRSRDRGSDLYSGMRHSNREVVISSQLPASSQACGGDHRGQVVSDWGEEHGRR